MCKKESRFQKLNNIEATPLVSDRLMGLFLH